MTDEGAVARAVDAAVGRFGRIDVLVNNAGFGVIGAIEEIDAIEVRRLRSRNHRQQGHPKTLALTLVAVVRPASPPLRLPLGTDAIQAIARRTRNSGASSRRCVSSPHRPTMGERRASAVGRGGRLGAFRAPLVGIA